ncbi:nitrogen regulation protein NR(II) [Lacimicrobium alkaliphilum]|uniref:Sensory histidine kinase/phosphatase NtrB n=1 Tax=Lacimicrobium alkaliphilum TaxID=1526571 RepID=A0ABQ1RAI8_9ALTE|nr:nitrogen regulation protein NR(II) [Lacimicrobium alkaliphilum]GGD62215.1 two-component system sensor histidine kinase NtrB [Lacimicrobium alkaliphilum]
MTTWSAQNLVSNLSVGILVVDESLAVCFANAAAESFFEQSCNQLQGQALSKIFLYSSLDTARLHKAIRYRDSFSDGEVQLTFADGRHTLAEITVSSLEKENNSYLLLEIKQIDNLKRISQENQQWAQQQAARDLVRGLAHEIKNPLGGLRGAAQLLEKELADLELQEYTGLIIEQADRLRNLVDRLLGPNHPPRFKWHNLHQLLEKIRTLLSLDDIAEIELYRDYDPSIPEVWVDDEKIQQAVLNIARNAVQALKGKGRIDFITRIERQVTIHGTRYPLCARIRIIDNGPGIPEQLKDTLFYPMTTGNQDGTGLGLSIAQTLIDHHRGKIEVDSWPGHTEFTIYLPIDKKEPK